jgi:isoquinoline 1-oxidoreductase beta subunit
VFPQNIRDGVDPVVFQGLNPGGPRLDRLQLPEPADRPCDAQPACAAGLLARREPEPERDLPRMFHRRLAHATRQDPLALRRKLMAKHPKHLAVLNAVAERAGWGTPAPDVNGQRVPRPGADHGFRQLCGGLRRGVGQPKDGQLKVHRIVAATDCGHAVNPQQIEAQVEGSFVYGLSAALYGECTSRTAASCRRTSTPTRC